MAFIECLLRTSSKKDVGSGPAKTDCQFYLQFYNLKYNLNWAYTTKVASRVSRLTQTWFAALGKGAQVISGSPYIETEQFSLLEVRLSTILPPKSKFGYL